MNKNKSEIVGENIDVETLLKNARLELGDLRCKLNSSKYTNDILEKRVNVLQAENDSLKQENMWLKRLVKAAEAFTGMKILED